METPGVWQACVVDGEADLRGLVALRLAGEGFEVTEAPEGRAALAAMDRLPPDIVVLESVLPDMDGFELLRTIRQASDVPVIVTTGRGEEADRITGLDLGADDYVVKPYSVGELMARVRAVCRRIRPSEAEGGLRFGELLIDRRSREVCVAETRVDLTQREFDLLAYLAASPGQVFSR